MTSLLLCFGGGVLLFTTFLHLAPEVRQSVEKLQASGELISLGDNLSLAELLFCGGFFFVYLIEEAVHALLDKKPEATEAALHRSVSLRRCNRGYSGDSQRQGTARSTDKSLTHDAKVTPLNQERGYGDGELDGSGLFLTRNSCHQETQGFERNGNLTSGRLDSNFKSGKSSTCPCDTFPGQNNVPTGRISPIYRFGSGPKEAAEQSRGLPAERTARNSFGNTTPLSQNERSYLAQNLQIVGGLDAVDSANSNPLCTASTSSASTSSGAASASPAAAPPNASIKGLLTVIALSFHAVFEGLAVGLEPSVASVIYLAAAIATHKLVIAFCVGMEMVAAGANARIVLGYLAVFAVVTPLGIGIGLLLGNLEDGDDGLGPLPALLQGTAAGTLLYVVFFEVLARERANEKSGLLQLAAILLGFMLMLGLQFVSESIPAITGTHFIYNISLIWFHF